MGRDDNVKIFQDTERLCKEKARLKNAIKHSIGAQQLILESDEIKISMYVFTILLQLPIQEVVLQEVQMHRKNVYADVQVYFSA